MIRNINDMNEFNPNFSICISCGKDKEKPTDVCPHCYTMISGYDEDVAKSVFLSLERYAELEEKRDYLPQLLEYGKMIRQGKTPPFDLDVIDALKVEVKRGEQKIHPSMIKLFIACLIIPLLLFSMIIAALKVIKRDEIKQLRQIKKEKLEAIEKARMK